MPVEPRERWASRETGMEFGVNPDAFRVYKREKVRLPYARHDKNHNHCCGIFPRIDLWPPRRCPQEASTG